MIQKRVEWHLNIPYDLHALAQKPKDCLKQKHTHTHTHTHTCLYRSGVDFRRDHNVISIQTAIFPSLTEKETPRKQQACSGQWL